MKLYVSNIDESYKDTIIENLGNSGIADLILHILQCWCIFIVDELKLDIPIVLYLLVKNMGKLKGNENTQTEKEVFSPIVEQAFCGMLLTT